MHELSLKKPMERNKTKTFPHPILKHHLGNMLLINDNFNSTMRRGYLQNKIFMIDQHLLIRLGHLVDAAHLNVVARAFTTIW
jgi:hypothetical protein